MNKTIATVFSIATIFLVAACADPKSDPAYVSPVQYEGYNCKQIGREMRLISRKIDTASQTQGTNQVLNAAVTAFAISQGYSVDDSQDNVELRRLHNEYDALEQTSIQKNCKE